MENILLPMSQGTKEPVNVIRPDMVVAMTVPRIRGKFRIPDWEAVTLLTTWK